MEKESILTSERCCIRPFMPKDIEDFMSYRNDLEWMKYQYFKGLSKEEYEEVLLADPSVEKGAQFAIIRKADQKLIGDVYVKKEKDTFWIGYTVSPSFKRQGYAEEVVRSLIHWIKQEGAFNIMAGTAPENMASAQLLEKLEFSQVEVNGVEVIYSLQPGSKRFGNDVQ